MKRYWTSLSLFFLPRPRLSTKYDDCFNKLTGIQSKTHKRLFLVPSWKQVIDLIKISNESMITATLLELTNYFPVLDMNCQRKLNAKASASKDLNEQLLIVNEHSKKFRILLRKKFLSSRNFKLKHKHESWKTFSTKTLRLRQVISHGERRVPVAKQVLHGNLEDFDTSRCFVVAIKVHPWNWLQWSIDSRNFVVVEEQMSPNLPILMYPKPEVVGNEFKRHRIVRLGSLLQL